jgi:hypothetical protein
MSKRELGRGLSRLLYDSQEEFNIANEKIVLERSLRSEIYRANMLEVELNNTVKSHNKLASDYNDLLRKFYDLERKNDLLRKFYDLERKLEIASDRANWLSSLMSSKTQEDNKRETKSKTYLLKDKNTGFYKIGKSVNPKNREKTLQSEKPTYELLKVWDKNIEKELHNKYATQRVRGEWFDLSKIQIKYICTHY